jgi:hypothetical protein
MAFNIKRNDTVPVFQAGLLDGSGLPIDLTGATVRFHMRDSDGIVVIDQPADIINPTTGTVQYSWVASDTDTSGTFQAEIEVTYALGEIETFPNSTYEEIIIIDDIT